MRVYVTETTLETTYQIQLQHRDGTWAFYTSAEFRTAENAAELAGSIYGGRVPTRIVEITRRVLDA